MAFQTIILFLNATFLFILGAQIWQRPVIGKKFFSLLLISAGFLSFMGGVESIIPEMNHKIMCSRIGYLGTVGIAPFWFLFTAQYSSHKILFYKKISYFFIAVSIIMLIFVFTNQYHNLIWPEISTVSEEYNSPLIYNHGIVLYIFSLYSYSLLIIGSIMFVKHVLKKSKSYRSEIILILTALLVPLVLNIIYIIVPEKFQGIDIMPLSFFITGVLLYLSIFKYKFLSVVDAGKDVFFNSINKGVIILNSEKIVMDINPAIKKIFNKKISIGMPIDDIDLNKFIPLNKIIEKNENYLFHINESDQWYDIHYNLVFNDEKQQVGHIIIFDNITKQRSAEKVLKKSEKRFKDISYSIADWIWETDKDGKYLYASGKVEEILGYKPEELIGKTPFDFMKESEIKGVKDKFIKMVKDKNKIVDLENINISKQGKEVIFLTNGVPIFGKDKNIIGYRGVDKDITRQKIAEEELKYRTEFEKLINIISKEFINTDIGHINEEILSTLKRIGIFSGVDRSYIFKFKDDLKKMQNTFEWCANGILCQKNNLQNLETTDFALLMKKLKKHEFLYIKKVNDLSEGDSFFKKHLNDQKIKSLVVVPLVYENNLLGFLGFDSVRKEKEWSNDMISLIRIVGEIIINSEQRVSEEKNIVSHSEELERMNKLMVGRELKMVELKDKIKKLKGSK